MVVVGLVLRVAVASEWGLLADEAYHWRWAQVPAWGYYDQPPLIAAVLAMGEAWLGSSPLALRSLPAGLGVLGMATLLPFCRDRLLFAAWITALPPLWLLTQLAVPDALLLGAWGAAVAGALAGGPLGWLQAGICGGLACLAKPTAWLLLPLLVVFTPAAERRRGLPWLGLAVASAMLLPHLAFNARHDWVMIRFQASEGLLSPYAPGLGGPLRQVAEQALFVTPLAALAGMGWWWRYRPGTPVGRRDRLLWAASAPVAAGFALAAVGGPPEAHWPAPAWLTVGAALARVPASAGIAWRRLAWAGVITAGLASGLVFAQSRLRLAPLALDPGTRPWASTALLQGLAAELEGAPAGCAGPVVLSERYQEAAIVAWGTQRPVRVVPGCGRPNQDSLWRGPLPTTGLFVRPSRGGPPTCLRAHYRHVDLIAEIEGRDPAGRELGPWQLFRATQGRGP